jgi:hypothetical protein
MYFSSPYKNPLLISNSKQIINQSYFSKLANSENFTKSLSITQSASIVRVSEHFSKMFRTDITCLMTSPLRRFSIQNGHHNRSLESAI